MEQFFVDKISTENQTQKHKFSIKFYYALLSKTTLGMETSVLITMIRVFRSKNYYLLRIFSF